MRVGRGGRVDIGRAVVLRDARQDPRVVGALLGARFVDCDDLAAEAERIFEAVDDIFCERGDAALPGRE